MSRRNPRIRPNSLTQRNWRTIAELAGREPRIRYQPGEAAQLHIGDLVVFGQRRKWYAGEAPETWGGAKSLLDVKWLALYRASTPRAAHIKALFATTRKP
jgi:hypothetical protein